MRSMLNVAVFVLAFLSGCLLSFDNALSPWPSIADIDVKNEKKVVCSLGVRSSDGSTSCVCTEVYE